MRYFFEIAYHGKPYAGWQSQRNAMGVQTVVEESLSKLFRTSVKIIGSGRTDTGVHCVQQYFHADLPENTNPTEYRSRINSILPSSISIQSIRKVNDIAHARYDATERTYIYRICLKKDPFKENLVLFLHKKPDILTMNEAASLLVGTHDFTSFSKVKTDVNHFICTIKNAGWKQKDDLLEFTITANRFLRGMVRALVGTLLDVGSGKISVNDFQKIVNARDRKKAGANVAPQGLYLVSVKYPPGIFKK